MISRDSSRVRTLVAVCAIGTLTVLGAGVPACVTPESSSLSERATGVPSTIPAGSRLELSARRTGGPEIDQDRQNCWRFGRVCYQNTPVVELTYLSGMPLEITDMDPGTYEIEGLYRSEGSKGTQWQGKRTGVHVDAKTAKVVLDLSAPNHHAKSFELRLRAAAPRPDRPVCALDHSGLWTCDQGSRENFRCTFREFSRTGCNQHALYVELQVALCEAHQNVYESEFSAGFICEKIP